MRKPRLWILVGVVAMATLGLHQVGTASDRKQQAAEFFAKGTKAFKAKDYVDAAAYFDEAYAYDKDRIDVLYHAGRAYEKARNMEAALAAYRLFIEAYDEMVKKEALPAALKTCRRKTEARLKSVGKATLQYEDLRRKHVEKLVAFAESQRETAPDVALRALERARDMAVEPGRFKERIRELRRRVDPAPDRVESPFERDVVAWRDLIALETFGMGPGWGYEDGMLKVERKGGAALLRRGETLDSGPRYVYEMEIRFRRLDSNQASAGLLFARKGEVGYVGLISPRSVLINSMYGQQYTILGVESRDFQKLGVWHRISVKVDGDTLEGWVDGEKYFPLDPVKLPSALRGNYGLYVYDVSIEIRELRIGELR